MEYGIIVVSVVAIVLFIIKNSKNNKMKREVDFL